MSTQGDPRLLLSREPHTLAHVTGWLLNQKLVLRKGAVVSTLLATSIAVASIIGGDPAGASQGPVGARVPKSGGVVNISGYSDGDGLKSVVILTGVIGDFGTAVRASTEKSSLQYNELELTLKRGSFTLDIAGIERDLAKSIVGKFPTNSTTCSGEVTVSGPASIDAGSGAGAYRGISGTFYLTIAINEVESPPACPRTDTAPFLAQSVFTTGLGTVSIPR
ncbi:MAG: hypothetical protein ACRDVC_10630 [Acidimicrobiales bacterium]